TLQPASYPAGELKIQKPFGGAAGLPAIAVPPWLLGSGQPVGVEIFDPDHLFQPEAAMGASDAAGFHPAMRSLTDSKTGDGIVYHHCACIDLPGDADRKSVV